MDRPGASLSAQLAYDHIAAELGPAGVTAGRMMGMQTLYLGGKAFAGLYGDAMVFKLADPDHGEAMALPGAVLFDPSGRGRPMKAWVQVPLTCAGDWPRLAERARLTAQDVAGG